jgi:hypothetical protein
MPLYQKHGMPLDRNRSLDAHERLEGVRNAFLRSLWVFIVYLLIFAISQR